MFGLLESYIYYISKALSKFNEIYPIPYFFHILIYKNIQNRNLKNHIDEKGKLLYEKVII